MKLRDVFLLSACLEHVLNACCYTKGCTCAIHGGSAGIPLTSFQAFEFGKTFAVTVHDLLKTLPFLTLPFN